MREDRELEDAVAPESSLPSSSSDVNKQLDEPVEDVRDICGRVGCEGICERVCGDVTTTGIAVLLEESGGGDRRVSDSRKDPPDKSPDLLNFFPIRLDFF